MGKITFVEDETPVEINPIFAKIIEKEYGKDLIVSGKFVLERSRVVIPISPSVDIGLNGGVPEGSWVSFSGDEKCGKTTLALTLAANAQKKEYGSKIVFYIDIEGRLKPLNLQGIAGLDVDAVQVVRSIQGKILSGEEFMTITSNVIKNHPGCVVIIDSISSLCSDKELTGDITSSGRVLGPKIMAAFTRQMSNVVPVQDTILISIKHLIANTSGFGAPKMEDGGRKVKYQGDVALKCKRVKPWEAGDKRIGQKTEWDVLYSALGPPGAKITSYIRYGIGVDKTRELFNIGEEFGLITKPAKGAWYTCDYLRDEIENVASVADYFKESGKKKDKSFLYQGEEKLLSFLNEHPHFLKMLEDNIRDML